MIEHTLHLTLKGLRGDHFDPLRFFLGNSKTSWDILNEILAIPSL